MIAAALHEDERVVRVTDVRLFDERDVPWIAAVLDIVEQSLDQPWRVLIERVEHAPLAVGRRLVSARARQQILTALRRVMGGRAERARIARQLRASVLGHPALGAGERTERLAAAGAELGIGPEDVEGLLWADLARERPVVLPSGRPDPLVVAAYANVDRIQGDMRRAREIELRVREDSAGSLVRMAARCGLVTTVVREDGGTLVLRIAGPLSMFHATTVYGRALGALVPLLVDHAELELAMHCDLASGSHTLRVATPIVLPPQRARKKPSLAERLAHELERREVRVEYDPPPIASGERVLFPDLALEYRGERWHVELVGFSTAHYLAEKLARYADANARVVLCCDTSRSKLTEAHPWVLAFERRVNVDRLVDVLEESR